MPFNWKTPLGYLIALLFECISSYYAALFLVPLLCFLFGSCFLLRSFVKDITNDLSLLNACTTSAKPKNKSGTNKNLTNTKRNDEKIEQIFRNSIQCHTELKQLSCDFIHTHSCM